MKTAANRSESWCWRQLLSPLSHVLMLVLTQLVCGRPKALTVFARSNAGIVGSNPTQCMNVCVRLFCVCVVLCVGSGLATGWSLVQGILPNVYRIKKFKKRPRFNKRDVAQQTDRQCTMNVDIVQCWGYLVPLRHVFTLLITSEHQYVTC
jgi:hypothetical protein